MRSARRSTLDLTAGARIRDSAVAYFGRHGFQSATVRAIAADAGVSPPLVLHHFGSKDGLREACDSYVTECIDGLTDHASTHLEARDLLDLLSRTPQLAPLVPYTIQAMTEGGRFAVPPTPPAGDVSSPDDDATQRGRTASPAPDIDIQAIATKFTVPTLELFTYGMFTTSDYLDAYVEHQRKGTA